jgi:ankyrin repeat protein
MNISFTIKIGKLFLVLFFVGGVVQSAANKMNLGGRPPRHEVRLPPLHQSCSKTDSSLQEVLRYLTPDNVNSRDGLGRTPLYYACRHQPMKEDVVSALLGIGAIVTGKDYNAAREAGMSIYLNGLFRDAMARK